MGSALTVRVRREQGCAIITIAGEVDIATVAQLSERLSELAASGRPLIADLDQVTFIDAAGIGTLVKVAGRCAAYGASLRVVCAQPQTRRLFRITKLDQYLKVSRTIADALQLIADGDGPGTDGPASGNSGFSAFPQRTPDSAPGECRPGRRVSSKLSAVPLGRHHRR
jgi:anti-sigma B factor antagonist